MILNKQIDTIIITRPAVEAGEKLGFLPGEAEDKYAPYIEPFRDILEERMGKGQVEYMIKAGKIKGSPFAYMRGKTFKNAVVILDEAQNATKNQMKLFLTRIGENCKIIVDGDITQSDIVNSGLDDAMKRLQFIPTVKVVEFGLHEVVRSGLASEIVRAYNSDDFVQ
jgi:phosphate starvation-inducible protein PhoH and related proteins